MQIIIFINSGLLMLFKIHATTIYLCQLPRLRDNDDLPTSLLRGEISSFWADSFALPDSWKIFLIEEVMEE